MKKFDPEKNMINLQGFEFSPIPATPHCRGYTESLANFLLFLQIMRTIIKAWTSLNFGGIPLPTSELAALEHLKKSNYKLVSSLVL